jgi:RNA polymerase sigma factor (sigma-70 family)
VSVAAAPTMSASDRNLADRFAREAEPLLDVLYRRAQKLTRRDADAEDLLQDALLDAYQGFHTFREGSNVKAWLFRILYNRWISTYRRRQSRPTEISVEELTERHLGARASRSPAGLRSAEEEALEALPDSRIRSAILDLPEDFRVVVYYSEVRGYTYAETAAVLDIPVGTAMSRASRARKRLRIALTPDFAAVEQRIA